MIHYVVKRNGRTVYAGMEWLTAVEALPPKYSREFSLICTEEKDGDAIRTYLTGVWFDKGDMKFENKEEEKLPLKLTKN
jgi:hypothetical protein